MVMVSTSRKYWDVFYELVFVADEEVTLYFQPERSAVLVVKGISNDRIVGYLIKFASIFFEKWEVDRVTPVYRISRKDFWKALRELKEYGVLELKVKDEYLLLTPPGVEEGVVVGRLVKVKDYVEGVLKELPIQPKELFDIERLWKEERLKFENEARLHARMLADYIALSKLRPGPEYLGIRWWGGELSITMWTYELVYLEIPRGEVSIVRYAGTSESVYEAWRFKIPRVDADLKIKSPLGKEVPVLFEMVNGTGFEFYMVVGPRLDATPPERLPEMVSIARFDRDKLDELKYVVEIVGEFLDYTTVWREGGRLKLCGLDGGETLYLRSIITPRDITGFDEPFMLEYLARRRHVKELVLRVCDVNATYGVDPYIGVSGLGWVFICGVVVGTLGEHRDVKRFEEMYGLKLDHFEAYAGTFRQTLELFQDYFATVQVQGEKLGRALSTARKRKAEYFRIAAYMELVRLFLDDVIKWESPEFEAVRTGPFTASVVHLDAIPIPDYIKPLKRATITISFAGTRPLLIHQRFDRVPTLTITSMSSIDVVELADWVESRGWARAPRDYEILDAVRRMPGATVTDLEVDLLSRAVSPRNIIYMLDKLVEKGLVEERDGRYYVKAPPTPPPPPPTPPPEFRELQEATRKIEPDIDSIVRSSEEAYRLFDGITRRFGELEAQADDLLRLYVEGRYSEVLAQADRVVRDLETGIADIERSLGELDGRLKDVKGRIESLERQLKELRERAEKAGVKPEDVNIVALEAKLAQAKTTIEGIARVDVGALRDKLRRVKEAVEDSKRKVAVAAPRVPVEKPKVVEEWEKRLRINIIGWREEVPLGFRYPVWVLWVRDEATGEIVRVVMGYPYTEHRRYKLVKVTNKAGHPVNLLAFVEEAPRVEVKVPPAPETSKAIEKAEAKVEAVKPEEVKAAIEEVTRLFAAKPFNWSEFKAFVRRYYEAITSWERAVEERNDTALYGYLTTFKDHARMWFERVGREIGETHERASEAQRTGRLPTPKLSREEIEKLWRYWEDTLRKHGIDPYKYKAEYFDEDVALASSYNEALKMLDIDLKFIIAQEELSKKSFEAEKVVKPPERFNWKDVGRGIAYIKLRLMWLEEAADKRDLMVAYELLRETLDATYRLLEILSLSPNVRKFKDITGL